MWKVQLIGDASDLTLLAKSFTSPGAQIEASGDGFLLSSSDFSGFDHVDDVREWLEEWLPSLNGANAILIASDKAIRAGAVYRYDESGEKSIFVCLQPVVAKARVLSPTVRIGQPDGTELVYRPTDPVRDWVKIARNDAAVSDVLKISSNPPFDWTKLYRLYEIVKADTHGTISKRGWASANKIELFTRSAQPARHGGSTHQPPATPMRLGEARSFVFGIIKNWIESKQQTS